MSATREAVARVLSLGADVLLVQEAVGMVKASDD